MSRYFVRIGALAEIHTASGDWELARGRRVLVRTERGIELGEVAAACGSNDVTAELPGVCIVRPTTREDELLIGRLNRHKRQAVEACRSELAHQGSTATLLDVDQIFDGGTLVMHFLGPVDDIAETITKRLADRYESIVRTRHFAKLLRDGCGPGCGTTNQSNCGTSCAECPNRKA